MSRCVRAVLAATLGMVILTAGACTSAQPDAPTDSSAPSAADTAEPATPAAAPEPAAPSAAGDSSTAAPNAAPAGAPGAEAKAPAAATPPAAPVIVVTTERGTFEFETYPNEAPKTVAQIVALVKRNFYNGQRIHRVEPGFVIQFGDPNTRDARLQHLWGTGSSGKPIGVGEPSPKRRHRRGAVAMAHAGDPAGADSQLYVVLENSPQASRLDGGYTVFGQVISGMDVVLKTRENDMIKRVTVREGSAPAAK